MIQATLKNISSKGFLISTTAAEASDGFYPADLFTLTENAINSLCLAHKNSGNIKCHRATGKLLEKHDLAIQSTEGYLFIGNKGKAVARAMQEAIS